MLGDLWQELDFYPIVSTQYSASHASLLLFTMAAAEQLERNQIWLLVLGKSNRMAPIKACLLEGKRVKHRKAHYNT